MRQNKLGLFDTYYLPKAVTTAMSVTLTKANSVVFFKTDPSVVYFTATICPISWLLSFVELRFNLLCSTPHFALFLVHYNSLNKQSLKVLRNVLLNLLKTVRYKFRKKYSWIF
jgi:hypothetical protein